MSKIFIPKSWFSHSLFGFSGKAVDDIMSNDKYVILFHNNN